MDQLAAIDIGTNSIRILMAKVEKDKILEVFKDMETTRIGENVDKTGELSVEAMERTLKGLKGFVEMAEELGYKEIPIIATSAVRDAKNRDVFIHRVQSEMNRKVEVIGGEREAYLGFLGVLMGMDGDDENILVIDIGGGSTEFILGNRYGIKHLISLNMGAVRMTEKFVNTDPMDGDEYRAMTIEIDRIMGSTIEEIRKFNMDRIIAIGGTATTIASVVQKLEVYDREKIHNMDIDRGQIKDMIKELMGKDIHQRKQMVGLHPKRADIITAGAIILDRILTQIQGASIRVSEYDNLEGLIFEQLSQRKRLNI